MSTINDVKGYFGEAFTFQNMLSAKNKRLWIDDNTFYITIAEIQPLRSDGFFLNMGVKFMWHIPDSIIYEFVEGETRIFPQNPPLLEAALYDSPDFEKELAFMKQGALKKLQAYRELKNLDVLAIRLRERKDLFYYTNQNNCNDVDVSLAIVEMLRGNRAVAMNIFDNTRDNPLTQELAPFCQSEEDFREELLRRIRDVKSQFSTNYRLSLTLPDSLPVQPQAQKRSFWSFFKAR